MRATIVDLRYRMKDVIRALDKNQSVTILYRGKVKATIVPVAAPKTESVRNSPLFGMHAGDAASSDTETVDAVMQRLRGGRY